MIERHGTDGFTTRKRGAVVSTHQILQKIVDALEDALYGRAMDEVGNRDMDGLDGWPDTHDARQKIAQDVTKALEFVKELLKIGL